MKIRNICIYIVFVIIIFSVFKLPEIMLELEENKIEEMSYKKQEKQSKIDIEYEKIYLVKAIHDIQAMKGIVITSNFEIAQTGKTPIEYYEMSVEIQDGAIQEELNNQIAKLENYNILKKDAQFNESTKDISFLFKMYQNDENKYIINNIKLKANDKDYNIEMESKTGKIIYILFNKNDICEISYKEILENYVKYLDLYIIDDWRYVEDLENKLYALISDKADLRVNLIDEGDDYYIMSLHINSLGY